MNTPKAFANFSPGFEHRENPWDMIQIATKPWKGSPVGEPFQGLILFNVPIPGLSLRSNPGLKLANASGVTPRLQLHFQNNRLS
jgi:hypothetical protein